MKSQKIRRKRFRKTQAGRPIMHDLLAQPSAAFYRLPEFSLRGGYLTTDGCRKVLDFQPDKISLDMGNFLVTFYGAELRIESFSGKRLILAGRIQDISFRSKWGEQGNEA